MAEQLQKTIFMPKALHEKWDKALRSGEYKQCVDVMHNPVSGGYCCLGVLEHCVDGDDAPDLGEQVPNLGWLEENSIVFHNWTGDSDCIPNDGEGTDGTHLATWNDDGRTFTEIADRIALIVEYTDEEAQGDNP